MEEPVKSKKFLQYFGAAAAGMGGFTLGTIIGWNSPAHDLLEAKHNFNTVELGWIGSVMTLGAAISAPCVIFIARKIGVRHTMIFMAIPFTLGWGLLLVPHIAGLIVGRFVQGFCGGCYCYCSPVFVGEISEAKIRGSLGVIFQLMIVLGILLSFALGIAENYYILTIPPTVLPVLMGVWILFIKNSPIYLLTKGKEEEARKALLYYRGKDYSPDAELQEMKDYIKASEVGPETNACQEIRTKPVTKSFLISLLMHFIQQLSGINAIMFFAHPIFEMAGSKLSTWASGLILGLVQVGATLFSCLIIERAGRKLLFLLSLSIMSACLIATGAFFYIKQKDEEKAKSISIIPLVAICLYILGFSLGTGPLPWVLLGEMFADSVKNILGPVCVCINWTMAFVVTMSFETTIEVIGTHTVFWIFAGFGILGVILLGIFLFETKGMTLVEIQRKFGAT